MIERDELGRLPAGSVPGWGASHWFAEQSLNARDMTGRECLDAMLQYWRAVAAGWYPQVPREQWVGSYDPFEATTAGEAPSTGDQPVDAS